MFKRAYYFIFLLAWNLSFASSGLITAATLTQTDTSFSMQLYFSSEVEFESKSLPFDSKNQVSARFFVDLHPVETSKEFVLPEINSHQWIQNIRIGKNAPNKLRLVLDLTSLGEKQLFRVEKNDKGILISTQGSIPPSDNLVITPAQKPVVATRAPSKEKLQKKYKVVIDPGHGGLDPGAKGIKGTLEKNVALQISKKVQSILNQDPNMTVYMTRETDKTLKLMDRTKFANEKEGDLFVSIHANASPRKNARGVSTYFLNNADDQESLRVAMRENGELDPSQLKVPTGSDDYYLELMKASMIKNFHTTQSTDLARQVQRNMLKNLQGQYVDIVDLGVRSARFYVLTGAKMPAILVETSFISNAIEEKRLASSAYQDRLAKAIVEGVRSYLISTQSSQHASIQH